MQKFYLASFLSIEIAKTEAIVVIRRDRRDRRDRRAGQTEQKMNKFMVI